MKKSLFIKKGCKQKTLIVIVFIILGFLITEVEMKFSNHLILNIKILMHYKIIIS